MKKIFLVLFAALLIACSAVNVFAEEGADVTTEAVSDVTTEAVSDESVDASAEVSSEASNQESAESSEKEEGADGEFNFDFAPSRFVDNLSKMGIGMLGIFIVMGVVIIVTTILNKATSKK